MIAPFRLSPHGRLFVLSVADHFARVQYAAWIVSTFEAFIEIQLPARR